MDINKLTKKQLIQLQEETMAKLEDMTLRVAIAKEGIDNTTKYIETFKSNLGALRSKVFDLGLDTDSRNQVLSLIDNFMDTL